MTPAELATWSLFGAALGRLTAKDTVAREPRNAVLAALGIRGVNGPTNRMDDLAAECRKGVGPLETHDEVTVQAPDRLRAKIAEGISCPSCAAFWAIAACRLMIEPRRARTLTFWRDTYAAWGLAAAIGRTTG